MHKNFSKKIKLFMITGFLFSQAYVFGGDAKEGSFDSWYSQQKEALSQAATLESSQKDGVIDLVKQECSKKIEDNSIGTEQKAFVKLLEHKAFYAEAAWSSCWQAYGQYLDLLSTAHDPNYAAGVALRSGEILYQQKNFEDCSQVCGVGMEYFSKNELSAEILLLQGKSLYELRDYAGSKRCLENLIATYKTSKVIPDARVWLAIVCAHLNDYERTFKLLDGVISKYPDTLAAQCALVYKGDIHMSSENYAEALVCYKKLYKTYPGSIYSKHVAKQQAVINEKMAQSPSQQAQ